MTFAAAKTVIGTHLVSAGTAIPNPIRNVRAGPPLYLNERIIRHWYIGDTESELIPDTLTDDTTAERVVVGCYWPIADGSEAVAEVLDVEMQALKAEIKHRLVGDQKLGGNCAGITVGDFNVDFVEVVGGWYAAMLTEVQVHLIDTDTIAD